MSLANAFSLLDDEGTEDVAILAKAAAKAEVKKEAPKKEEPAKPGENDPSGLSALQITAWTHV